MQKWADALAEHLPVVRWQPLAGGPAVQVLRDIGRMLQPTTGQ